MISNTSPLSLIPYVPLSTPFKVLDLFFNYCYIYCIYMCTYMHRYIQPSPFSIAHMCNGFRNDCSELDNLLGLTPPCRAMGNRWVPREGATSSTLLDPSVSFYPIVLPFVWLRLPVWYNL